MSSDDDDFFDNASNPFRDNTQREDDLDDVASHSMSTSQQRNTNNNTNQNVVGQSEGMLSLSTTDLQKKNKHEKHDSDDDADEDDHDDVFGESDNPFANAKHGKDGDDDDDEDDDNNLTLVREPSRNKKTMPIDQDIFSNAKTSTNNNNHKPKNDDENHNLLKVDEQLAIHSNSGVLGDAKTASRMLSKNDGFFNDNDHPSETAATKNNKKTTGAPPAPAPAPAQAPATNTMMGMDFASLFTPEKVVLDDFTNDEAEESKIPNLEVEQLPVGAAVWIIHTRQVKMLAQSLWSPEMDEFCGTGLGGRVVRHTKNKLSTLVAFERLGTLGKVKATFGDDGKQQNQTGADDVDGEEKNERVDDEDLKVVLTLTFPRASLALHPPAKRPGGKSARKGDGGMKFGLDPRAAPSRAKRLKNDMVSIAAAKREIIDPTAPVNPNYYKKKKAAREENEQIMKKQRDELQKDAGERNLSDFYRRFLFSSLNNNNTGKNNQNDNNNNATSAASYGEALSGKKVFFSDFDRDTLLNFFVQHHIDLDLLQQQQTNDGNNHSDAEHPSSTHDSYYYNYFKEDVQQILTKFILQNEKNGSQQVQTFNEAKCRQFIAKLVLKLFFPNSHPHQENNNNNTVSTENGQIISSSQSYEIVDPPKKEQTPEMWSRCLLEIDEEVKLIKQQQNGAAREVAASSVTMTVDKLTTTEDELLLLLHLLAWKIHILRGDIENATSKDLVLSILQHLSDYASAVAAEKLIALTPAEAIFAASTVTSPSLSPLASPTVTRARDNSKSSNASSGQQQQQQIQTQTQNQHDSSITASAANTNHHHRLSQFFYLITPIYHFFASLNNGLPSLQASVRLACYNSQTAAFSLKFVLDKHSYGRTGMLCDRYVMRHDELARHCGAPFCIPLSLVSVAEQAMPYCANCGAVSTPQVLFSGVAAGASHLHHNQQLQQQRSPAHQQQHSDCNKNNGNAAASSARLPSSTAYPYLNTANLLQSNLCGTATPRRNRREFQKQLFANSHSANSGNWVKCPKGTSLIFCSAACCDNAWNTFLRVERAGKDYGRVFRSLYYFFQAQATQFSDDIRAAFIIMLRCFSLALSEMRYPPSSSSSIDSANNNNSTETPRSFWNQKQQFQSLSALSHHDRSSSSVVDDSGSTSSGVDSNNNNNNKHSTAVSENTKNDKSNASSTSSPQTTCCYYVIKSKQGAFFDDDCDADGLTEGHLHNHHHQHQRGISDLNLDTSQNNTAIAHEPGKKQQMLSLLYPHANLHNNASEGDQSLLRGKCDAPNESTATHPPTEHENDDSEGNNNNNNNSNDGCGQGNETATWGPLLVETNYLPAPRTNWTQVEMLSCFAKFGVYPPPQNVQIEGDLVKYLKQTIYPSFMEALYDEEKRPIFEQGLENAGGGHNHAMLNASQNSTASKSNQQQPSRGPQRSKATAVVDETNTNKKPLKSFINFTEEILMDLFIGCFEYGRIVDVCEETTSLLVNTHRKKNAKNRGNNKNKSSGANDDDVQDSAASTPNSHETQDDDNSTRQRGDDDDDDDDDVAFCDDGAGDDEDNEDDNEKSKQQNYYSMIPRRRFAVLSPFATFNAIAVSPNHDKKNCENDEDNGKAGISAKHDCTAISPPKPSLPKKNQAEDDEMGENNTHNVHDTKNNNNNGEESQETQQIRQNLSIHKKVMSMLSKTNCKLKLFPNGDISVVATNEKTIPQYSHLRCA